MSMGELYIIIVGAAFVLMILWNIWGCDIRLKRVERLLESLVYEAKELPPPESHIMALLDDTLMVRKPIPVTVTRAGAEYVAQTTFTDEANVHASGETTAEAIENLRDMIAATFNCYSSSPEALAPVPRQTLAALRQYIAIAPKYGITATELHDRIIEDLESYCQHVAIETRALDNPDARPLEQTIRMVCQAALMTADYAKDK